MDSASLFERAQNLLPGGVNSPVRAFRSVGSTPFFTRRAEGAHLHTVDGHSLIDFVGTWGPAIHGHNDPDIRAALALALESGTSFGTPHPLEIELAELVVSAVPSLEMVRFCNSGTEATMSAIRLARGITGRNKIIKFAGCYHGHVDSLLVKAGSGALTMGNPDSAGIPPAFAGETIVLDYNDAPAVETAFADYPDQIAAIIVEPFPANVGLILPHEGYLQALRNLTQAHGALLIFDEVMTGFRLGMGGVQAMTGVTPDLTAMGKIIGGGLPVGAFGGKREHMEMLAPLGPVYQAGTLSGNPLAMAAGIASLKKLLQLDPYSDLEAAGKQIAGALTNTAIAKGLPLQVPQSGSMFALFFAEEPVHNFPMACASRTTHFNSLFQAALKEGVFLPPSPFETAFISCAHSPEIIDKASEVLVRALQSF